MRTGLIVFLMLLLLFAPVGDTKGIVIGYDDSQLILRYRVLGGYQMAVIPNTGLRLGDEVLLRNKIPLLDFLLLGKKEAKI